MGLPQDKISLAINTVDFKLGLDHASSKMIEEHMAKTENRQLMRELIKVMPKNDFFKLFVTKYQKNLTKALEIGLEMDDGPSKAAANSNDGDQADEDQAKKAAPKKNIKNVKYQKQILDHINGANYYRKHLPNIFTGEDKADPSSLLQEKLKMLAPVPLPIDVKKANDHQKSMHEQTLKRNASQNMNMDINSVTPRAQITKDGI